MPRIDLRKQHKLGMAPVLGMAAYAKSHVPNPLRELVDLRASELNQCHYCLDMHTRALRRAGEDEDRIQAARTGELPHPLLDDRENAALALTVAVTRLEPAVGVSDEIWDEAARHFDAKELGDLVLAIATINVFNRVNVAVRMEA